MSDHHVILNKYKEYSVWCPVSGKERMVKSAIDATEVVCPDCDVVVAVSLHDRSVRKYHSQVRTPRWKKEEVEEIP